MNDLVTAFAFNQIYADDLAKAVEFYGRHFGFKVEHKMPDGSVWGNAGPIAFWIGGGYRRSDQAPDQTRTSIMYKVKSAHEFHRQLIKDGVRMIQDSPQNMGSGKFWFQFFDPAGNILEVLGDE